MTNSEARKRMATREPDDSGAIGRLNEALAAHRHSFGNNDGRVWSFCACSPNVELAGADGSLPEAGHPFYVEGIAAYRAHVAEHLAAIVRKHTVRALAEVEQRIEASEWFVFDDEDVDPEDEFVRRADAIAIVRAARQEQGR